MKIETRAVSMTATDKPLILEGYAVVFDTPAKVGDFEEIILRDALRFTDLSDVALFYNHDINRIPLARTPQTLKLEIDDHGLKFIAELPATEEGKAIYESVKRGDLRGCSFAFTVEKDIWVKNQRIIRRIGKIYECSIVPYPAYTDTTIEARSKGVLKMKFENVAQAFNFYNQKTIAQIEKRAGEFNTSTNSAAIIPTETLNEIISKARKQGGLLSECRMFSVPANVAIPVATPKSKAQWHTEGAEVDSEKIDLTESVTFSGNEIIKVFSISLKIQSMAISAFESYLTDELTNCVMAAIEDALINGTGNGQGTGILSIFDSSNTVTATAGIKYSDVIAAVSKLERGYANGAKFAMNNRTLWQVFYGMVDGNQRPIFIQDLQNESIGKILGFPIVIDDNLADDTIIFGDFHYLAYNLPAGIVIETSRESSFKRALIDFRAVAIADTRPLISDAFVKLTA